MTKERFKKASYVRYKTTKQPAIKIEFSFDWQTVFYVKTLAGSQYRVDAQGNKYWICPLTKSNLRTLQDKGFDVDERLAGYLSSQQTAFIEAKIAQVKEIDAPGLKGKLHPFQKQGVGFIESKGGRALIADQMGLGKTVQALAWLQLHPELRPAMIVTPASLKLFWESMIHEWLPPCRTKVLYGIRPYSTAFKNIVIINYDILQGWKQALHDVSPKVLILDESHYIMHDKAKRTKATKTLSRGVQHIIALSGTPFLNRPIEIYNTISLINPDLFSDRWHFAERYCDLRHNGWGWDFSGASNKLELYQLLTSSIMIRRRKADVLDQLPPKTRAIIPIELDNEDEYREIEDDFLNWMTKHSGEAAARRASRAEHLVKEEKLKQAAIQGKIRRSMEWIQDYITSEGKLAIFVTHTSTVDILMERFKKVAIKMDGRDPTTIRKNIVDKFQGDPNILLFIGMIDVMGRPAGVGWTLTAATAVAFLELQWSPLTIEQAEDRVYGRLNDPHGAIIYFLLAPNSIEEKIIKMIDRKRKVIDSILDGEETTTGALLSEIIKEQKQRRSEHEN